MKHTLVALVQDKPGVLNRVASLFRRRAFNIESLTVGHTDQPHVSRMTIVIDSDMTSAHLVEANLAKLVNVIDIQDVTQQDTISRDLALIKVRVDAAGRAEIAQLVPGTYASEGTVDNDGYTDEPVHLQIRIEITPDGVHFDTTGFAPMMNRHCV